MVAVLDSFNGVTQSSRGTLFDHIDDGLKSRRIRIHPRFLISVEHGLEFISAETRMRANSTVVVYRDLLSDIGISLVERSVCEFFVGEID